jgi:hypothetical protein
VIGVKAHPAVLITSLHPPLPQFFKPLSKSVTFAMRAPEGQLFKAMREDAIQRMHADFMQRDAMAQTDVFYPTALAARRRGEKNFTLPPGFVFGKSTGDEVINYDVLPGLGSVRLRHSSTSQPLVPGDADFGFSLPFEKNVLLVEQLWNYFLQLEDLSRQEGQRRKANDLFRYIVHSLQLDSTSDAITPVDPGKHQRLAFFLTDAKGQGFLMRFVDIMPQGSLKKFFFASFVVFQEVKIDRQGKFAAFFLQKLTQYLLEGVKPKWLAAFIRQASAQGFVGIGTDRFRAGCLAALLKLAATVFRGLDEGNSKIIRVAVDAIAEKIVAELKEVIQGEYSLLFMHVIVNSVLAVSPQSPLKALLAATSV